MIMNKTKTIAFVLLLLNATGLSAGGWQRAMTEGAGAGAPVERRVKADERIAAVGEALKRGARNREPLARPQGDNQEDNTGPCDACGAAAILIGYGLFQMVRILL